LTIEGKWVKALCIWQSLNSWIWLV
jgi:hypothetical protein